MSQPTKFLKAKISRNCLEKSFENPGTRFLSGLRTISCQPFERIVEIYIPCCHNIAAIQLIEWHLFLWSLLASRSHSYISSHLVIIFCFSFFSINNIQMIEERKKNQKIWNVYLLFCRKTTYHKSVLFTLKYFSCFFLHSNNNNNIFTIQT